MLALIERELKLARPGLCHPHRRYKDREEQVRRFQAGEVPIFLISLRAGGVGLNLTAADTVIHYDPWWNPAAENQATDRAHRLGQDKPVFVYKLIVAGSIEKRSSPSRSARRNLRHAFSPPTAASMPSSAATTFRAVRAAARLNGASSCRCRRPWRG
jgi:SNF2 family DNA or RNA helicase